jgi:hypothetical protein
MTNKDKINRVKEIEAQQLPLMDSLKIVDNLIRSLDSNSTEYTMAREIYDEHSIDMKLLISEKVSLLIGMGFKPADGIINNSIKDTDLWKSLENDVAEIIMASKEVSDARYSLCTNCPEFVTISKQCKPLGLFAQEHSSIESSTCPIGNW